MIGKLSLAAGLVAVGLLAAPGATPAAPLTQSLAPSAGADMSLVQEVRHRHRHRIVRLHRHRHIHRHRFVYVYGGGGYCSVWRHRCAARWGWQTRRYYRCIWRHGC